MQVWSAAKKLTSHVVIVKWFRRSLCEALQVMSACFGSLYCTCKSLCNVELTWIFCKMKLLPVKFTQVAACT